MMMFSTANFSKIMPCFLFFYQHYKQEWIPVLSKPIHTNIWPQKCTQDSSAPSTPRTLLSITGSAMPTAALFTSPRSSIFQRVHGCTWWGEARPEERIQNGQQESSSLSDTVGVQIGLTLIQQWSQSKTVSAWKLAGQGRGNMLKWEQGTGSTSLSGERNSLPLPQQPRATVVGVGKGCDLL